MAVQLLKRLFTVEEYHEMGKAGILAEGDRLELIEGELVEMAAIGTRHAGCVNRITRIFCRLPEERAIVTVQNPIQVSRRTEPQPDLVLLQPRADYYSTAHPLLLLTAKLPMVADVQLNSNRREVVTTLNPVVAQFAG